MVGLLPLLLLDLPLSARVATTTLYYFNMAQQQQIEFIKAELIKTQTENELLQNEMNSSSKQTF